MNLDISPKIINVLKERMFKDFYSVLKEIISNAWDADANNLWITIDNHNKSILIEDDGIGMDEITLQNCFLKFGDTYKRKFNINFSPKGRPLIGHKGLGKIALLFNSNTLNIARKTKDKEIITMSINNPNFINGLINNQLNDLQINLLNNNATFYKNLVDKNNGTIIHFENLYHQIEIDVEKIKKWIVLNFNFHWIDNKFNIYVNGVKITFSEIDDLIKNTQAIWIVNNDKSKDNSILDNAFSYVKHRENLYFNNVAKVYGYIASVNVPKNLIIEKLKRKASVDVFYNGIRVEQDLLKYDLNDSSVHPKYLYGQIHFEDLDSNKENINSNSLEFKALVNEYCNNVRPELYKNWDLIRKKPDEKNLEKIEGEEILISN